MSDAKPPMLAYVTISSEQPGRLTEFYRGLLDNEVQFQDGAYTTIGGGPNRPVCLAFQQVGARPPAAVHVDLAVADLDAAAERVVALGGRLGERFEEVGSVWRQAFDPDGNVFCLLTSPGSTEDT